MQIKSGYKPSVHSPEHKQFRTSNELGGAVLNVSGQWQPWAPAQDEQQNVGIEPEDCTSEGTMDGLQTLAQMLYNDSTEWSKRFLAYASNTTVEGNDPKTVIDTLEKVGVPPETDWPNTSELTTWAMFYTAPPQAIYTKALEYLAQYAVDWEWVATDQASLMQALQYSPIGVSGFAWNFDPTVGYYTSPAGTTPCHWFVIIGYLANNYWVVFDSYEQNIKKLAWDFSFGEAMRYSLSTNVVNPSAWQQFLSFMRAILGF